MLHSPTCHLLDRYRCFTVFGKSLSLHKWAAEDWDGIDAADRAEVAETLREIDDEDDFDELVLRDVDPER